MDKIQHEATGELGLASVPSTSGAEESVANGAPATGAGGRSYRTAATRTGRLWTLVATLALGVVALGIIEWVVRVKHVSPAIFPAPSAVLSDLWTRIGDGRLYPSVWVTFQEVILGFFAGASIGVLVGTLVGQIRLVERLVYPYIVALQAVPKVALAPFFLIWFGFGMTSKVLLAASATFFPVMVNLIKGLESSDSDQIRLLRAYGASEWQVFRFVKSKNALPYFFAGLELSIVLSVIMAVVAEFVGSSEGLGNMIALSNTTLDTTAGFAAMVVLSLLGSALHAVIVLVGRKVVFWRERQ